MAEPAQQTSIVDRLRSFGLGPEDLYRAATRAISPAMIPMDLLRQYYTRSAAPAPQTTQVAPEERGAPAAASAGAPAGTSAAPPRASSVVTPGAAAAPVPVATPVASEPSLLETLRQAVARDVAPQESTANNLAAFGRGVLSNRGSFLDNLSAGLAAQEDAAKSRRTEMRQALEVQARIAEAERKAKNEEAKLAAEAPLREAQAYYYRNFAGRRPGEGAGTPRIMSQRDIANLRIQADRLALTEIDKLYSGPFAPPRGPDYARQVREKSDELFMKAVEDARRGGAVFERDPMASSAPANPAVPTIQPRSQAAQ